MVSLHCSGKGSTAAAVLSIGLALLVAGALLLVPAFGIRAYAAEGDFGESIQAAVPAISTQADESSSSKPAKPSKKQLKKFKKASADFSLELFQRCVAAKGKNANVTIAPMSIMTALAVTANGAKGKTLKQMRNVLGDGASMARINKNLAWYNSKLVNAKKAIVRSANSIWYHNDGTLVMKKAFLKKAKKYYDAQVNPADFSDHATVDDINSWVSDATNGMIDHVVSQLDPSDRIAILNALYFDAEWRVPFDASDTLTQTFTNAKGKKRKVKMMHSTEHSYIEGENVTGFIKPYVKGYSYVALLPAEGMTAKDYVKTLDGTTFRNLVAKASVETVHVSLPKYSLSYTNDGMDVQLRAMGITKAFTSSANFKKMGKDASGNLSIDAVIHKTKVEVDEKGTKAAAVTAIVMKATSTAVQDVKVVTLDRPFVYAIVDNTTKLPVFIGTVSNPSA